ncbi:MAG: DNA translocase FtsK [Bacteroidales bacterium]|nr:DNA translocase FtsK [Bacteroidales bacterium]
MALKTKKSENSNRKKRRSRDNFFMNEKFKFILGIFILLIAAYLLISFVSFLFYGSDDHSRLDLPWRELIWNSEIHVSNKAGKTGAYLSDLIMNRGFGFASFIFIYILSITGLRILGRKIVKYKRSLIFYLVLLVWISICLGFVFPKKDAASYIYPGGQYGFVLSSWLSSLVGNPGLILILFITGLTIIIVRFESAYDKIKSLFRKRVKPEILSQPAESDERIEVEESVSKVIDGDRDVVQAVFDPDSEDQGSDEIANHPVSTKENVSNDEEGLELTVHKIKEEEGDKEYEAGEMEEYDPTLELSRYKFPNLDLLEDHSSDNAEVSNEELIANKNKIVETLRHYKIEITKIRATIGPTIKLYEIVPAPGIRIAKIKNLEDDIALSLAALGIRIIAPIPGRGTIGIEVPNQNPEIVSMRSILGSRRFQESLAELPVALGKTISNETYMFDLAKMPHILVAGATGQGKSVGVNVIITSLLYKKHPSQLKFVFVDPKKVELTLYSALEKHYLAKLPNDDEPVITDIQKVKYTLNSINVEMDQRYDLLKKAHARNVKEYNKKFIQRKLNPEKGHRYMPYIVIIIDEFADLIMTAGKEIELPIARIAQLARAVGIHMIIATQRPSTNIITGVIKANFPARIAFKVASMIDSRTILDTPGANQLIGKGDMLIASGGELIRVQCAFVDTPEVEAICSFISGQQGYPTAFMLPEYNEDEEAGPGNVDLNNRDELFDDAARVVVMNQMGSTSMIQRKFSIGYNRAGRIMDQLEVAGVVGPSEGSKPRQVLMQDEYSLERLLNSLN